MTRCETLLDEREPMGSQFYKYSELARKGTTYARRMDRLSKRIFGEVVRPTNPTSFRVVDRLARRPDDLNPQIVRYYPRHEETGKIMLLLRDYGLFRDEHEDFQEEMVRLRILRGKGKPRKGEGKRTKDK
ncbi:unnamed protein product [Darwinula stevensoni]|uniref:Small ribosomal subunit protein mS33 n=1 Tax=Darwinula stevensoni TaxID=69355 RepID=A0A7R9A868_9CRUS|nr:unnamed protein product [Darwinula stevensoni]CAG0895922.1 unnamed protein product [Darwinula stevensoni]